MALSLDLASYRIDAAGFGAATALSGHRLTADREALRAAVLADDRIRDVELSWALPGERIRIIHVLDAVEPRCKVDGLAGDFPGLLTPPGIAGQGRTHRLEGVAVIAAALISGDQAGLTVKEAILDMSGPGASFTPLSRTRNLVVTPLLRPGLSVTESCDAARRAALRTAVLLARSSLDSVPDRTETLRLAPAPEGLPRVVYVSPLMREGEVHDTLVYGESITPSGLWMHPNEVLDGAIASGDYHMAPCRSSTYYFQNNPVIAALCRRHGRELNLLGCVFAQGCVVGEAAKERNAWLAAKQCHLARADGVVISMAGGGHGYADLHLICQKCERLGIKTVVIQAELGDDEGADTSLVAFTPEADAIVSTGNQDEVVALPPMERVLGGDDAWNDFNNYEGAVGAKPTDGFRTSLRRVFQATEQFGSGRCTARAY